MALSESAFSSQGIPSHPARSKAQGAGNTYRPAGGRPQYNQQRNTEARSGPASVPAQIPEGRAPRSVPGATYAGPSNEVANSSSLQPITPSAPSGKKNRRQRGRGKTQGVTTPPDQKSVTFLSLPFELRERIMSEAYQMTLDELPASRPHVTDKPLDMSPAAVQLRRRRPAAITVLRNYRPRVGLNAKGRKGFLWNNPGQWGPVFQVMYSCKALYEEAKAIRYREIRVDARNFEYNAETSNDNILLSRLEYQVIREYTKYVAMEIHHRQATITIQNLVEAFRNMKSLKHICIIVRGHPDYQNAKFGSDKDILKFFDLDIETITIKWVWWDLSDEFALEPNVFYGPNGEEWITTVAEMRLQDLQEAWWTDTF